MNIKDLEKLSPETLGKLNDALHEVLCEPIITLIKDSLCDPEITKEEIKSAKELALTPKTDTTQVASIS